MVSKRRLRLKIGLSEWSPIKSSMRDKTLNVQRFIRYHGMFSVGIGGGVWTAPARRRTRRLILF